MDTLYTFIVLPTIKLKVYTFWGLMNSSTKKILDDFLIFHHPTPAWSLGFDYSPSDCGYV